MPTPGRKPRQVTVRSTGDYSDAALAAFARLVKRGVPFYLLANRAGDTRTWTGKGQVPGWVREWQAHGGELAALKAVL
jgi:DNA-binding protein H-NS